MNKLTDQIQAEVNKVVLGKEDIVRKVLLAILHRAMCCWRMSPV